MITQRNPHRLGLRGASPRSARSLAIRATPAIRCGTSSAATTSPRPYALRGRLRCWLCQRRLQGQWVRGEAYYRCRYPTEYAHSAHLDHPVNVYLRETDLVPKLDTWLARLVSPANIETTCRRLAAAHAQPAASDDVGLRAAQQALAAGLDLDDPEQRAVFYEEMGVSGLYQPANRIVLITAKPDMRRRTVRVGGATPTFGIPAAEHDADAVSSGDSGRPSRRDAAGPCCRAARGRRRLLER